MKTETQDATQTREPGLHSLKAMVLGTVAGMYNAPIHIGELIAREELNESPIKQTREEVLKNAMKMDKGGAIVGDAAGTLSSYAITLMSMVGWIEIGKNLVDYLS